MIVKDIDFSKLPVYRHREEILKALRDNQVIVVESPTGTGKTTQLPQILYEDGYAEKGIIGVTQPRRIATLSVTQFIAYQMKKQIPDTVGYKMRFEDLTDVTTKIKIMTDGILLQELKTDYYLQNYSVIIVDEAHERSLNIDFILGFLKRILKKRKSFRVIVSSATINAEVFSHYFDECPIVRIDAQSYPVDIIYDPPFPETSHDAMMMKIVETVRKIVESDKQGDILIFLQGEQSIKECISNLYSLDYKNKLEILPLYSRLSVEEQEKVFLDYPGKIKVIVATNIAETSVTIDGVTTVIDSGYAKMNFFNPRNYTSSLIEIPIPKSSCNQRKGRAGRTQPGVCYRLYSQANYESRPLFPKEEIYRTDLSEVILRMAEIGIKDFENFDFISPPGTTEIESAVETLKYLDALDNNRELTNIGKMMAKFPILPRHSRMIVEAILHYPNVIEQVTIVAAFLSTKTPFLLPQGEEIEARKAHHSFSDPNGDFYSYVKLFRRYKNSKNKENFCQNYYLDTKTMQEIANIKDQLIEIISEMGVPISSTGSISDFLCAVSRGLVQSICINIGRGLYRSITASKIQIHPGSVMFRKDPKYIVAGEIVRTSRLYARSVSPLKESWLKRIDPKILKTLLSRKENVKTRKRDRDFTNNIKIGREIFPIKRIKGNQRRVVLEWEKIRPLMEITDLALLPNYKKLKGVILYNKYSIMEGVKLNILLFAIQNMEPTLKIIKNWPRGHNFTKNLNKKIFKTGVNNILKLCNLKNKKKKLGFLTLETDGYGTYWFKCRKNFLDAVSESLSSLEILADEASNLEEETLNIVNKKYRMLSEIFER